MGCYQCIVFLAVIAGLIMYIRNEYSDIIQEIMEAENAISFAGAINKLLTPSLYVTIPTDSSGYEWTAILRNNTDIILNEYINFLNQYPMYTDKSRINTLYPEQNYLNEDKQIWSVLTLRCYGSDTDISNIYFPQTMKLFHECDKYHTIPQIMFSILDPYKSIPSHHGYYRGIFRYHLGILVPEIKNDLYLEIWPNTTDNDIDYYDIENISDSKILVWKNASDFIFDDTNWHKVVNNNNKKRTVMFIDIERHDLSLFQSIINKIIIHGVRHVYDLCLPVNSIQNDIVGICPN